MAKVIEQFKYTNQDENFDVLLYRDEEEGYGVEILLNDHRLANYAFGNDSVECHNVVYGWYHTLMATADHQSGAEFKALLHPSIIMPENKRISDDDLDVIHNIISDTYDTIGGHPLNKAVLNVTRTLYKSDAPTPVWVSQVVVSNLR